MARAGSDGHLSQQQVAVTNTAQHVVCSAWLLSNLALAKVASKGRKEHCIIEQPP